MHVAVVPGSMYTSNVTSTRSGLTTVYPKSL
ncbi:Uncharacterised protein [Mycobacteroides abscessus]|nr:Uncharacterised protein [Mycobacteroides abscessus]